MEKTINIITDKLESWGEAIVAMLPNFVLAVLIVIATWIAARYIKKGFKKLINRTYNNEELTAILSQIVYVICIIVGTLIALQVLDLKQTVTSILAGAGIVGLALGFAFQDMAANFVSGFFMAAKKPFKIGDAIEVNDFTGVVSKISLRTTEIKTMDGNEVILPNRILYENPVINYYQSSTRRVELEVGVSYGDDLKKAKEVAEEAVKDLEMRIKDEPLQVFYKEFGDSSINMMIRYWVPYERHYNYLEGLSEGIIAIKEAFDKNDIAIPFPIRTLDFGIKGGNPLSKELNGKMVQLDKTNAS